MADIKTGEQRVSNTGDGQQKKTDSVTLLVTEQPISSSLRQPQKGTPYIPSSKCQAPVLSAPEMFTGGSPLGVHLSIDKPDQLTLGQRIRRRLPPRATVVMFLSCFAFWLCGVVFGLLAFFLELHARYLAQTGSLDDRKKVPRLRKVSCVLSIVGIIVGSIVIVSVTCGLVIPAQYQYRYYDYSWSYDNRWNPNLDPNKCTNYGYYPFQSTCYKYRSQFSCSSCLARNGSYSNGNCYNNYAYSCPGFTINNNNRYDSYDQCFASRLPSNADECRDGVYDNGYCYFTPKPDCDGYFVGCSCYTKMSTIFTEATCENNGGIYNRGGSYEYSRPDGTTVFIDDNTCYYNLFDCSSANYHINGQCSSDRSQNYSAGTCKNIGGFMDSGTGYCYHNGFKCRDDTYGNQCYRTRSILPSCKSCANTGGNLGGTNGRHFDCYYYNRSNYSASCNYYLVPSPIPVAYYATNSEQFACEQNRSSAYNEQQCGELDGIYSNNYCYYTPSQCHNYTYQCQCYNYRSSLSQSACNAYDGTYDSTHSLCYYNSTVCNYYVFNNACYRNRYFQLSCSFGVFDAYNGACYY